MIQILLLFFALEGISNKWRVTHNIVEINVAGYRLRCCSVDIDFITVQINGPILCRRFLHRRNVGAFDGINIGLFGNDDRVILRHIPLCPIFPQRIAFLDVGIALQRQEVDVVLHNLFCLGHSRMTSFSSRRRLR